MPRNRNKNLAKPETKIDISQKSAERLRSIFAASPDAITVTDLKGTIVDCNKAALEVYGSTSKQDLIGKSAFELIAKKDRKQAKENMMKTLKQGSLRNTGYVLLRKNGAEYPAELSASVVRDTSGNPTAFVAIIKDITERKEAEMTLRESQQKFERLFMRNPEAAFYADAKWHIIDINPRFTQLFGYAKDEVKGKRTFDLLVPKSRKQESAMLGRKSKTGYTYYETIRKRKDHSLVHVSISVAPIKVDGHLVGYVGLYKDITESKKTEEALSESEKRFRSVVDNIGIGISVISPKMEILSLNNQMKKWFPRVDVSKKPVCYKVFNKPSGKRVCYYCPTVKTLKSGRIHEAITNTPNGKKIINYRVVSSPLKDKAGKVIAAIEMVDDITERKQMEEKLKQYSRQLEKLVEERNSKLQESETRFGSVANYASEAVITLDKKGVIVFWNKAAENIFGYTVDEAVGKPITLMTPKHTYQNHQKSMRTMISKKNFGYAGKTFELIGLRKDKTEFPMELSFSIWKTREGNFFTGIIRDTTERKKMEEERKHYEEMLSALNSCGGKLNTARSLKEVYELTLDAMEWTLGFEHASFMIIDSGKLKPVHQRGYSAPLHFELPLDGTKKGITVRAATKREACLVPDVTKDEDYIKGDRRSTDQICSELAVPVMFEDQVLGVLNVESKKLKAFDDKDVMLLQILASHAATAISSLKKRDEIEKRISQQASLMKSSTEMIHSTELRQRLQAILDAIQGLGWRRVVLSVRDENLGITKPEDIVTAGLTDKEREFLWTNKQPGQVWAERFGPDYARFRIGEFYYLPWSDAFVRKKFSQGTVESHLSSEEMVDWNPDDLLYAPLRLADGRIVGVVSMDDPVDGRRPTSDSLAPLELFLHQAAVAIENARLIKQLNDANTQIQEYAGHLEVKVVERTRELIDAQNKLLKAERLAAIGELAGMVGHDLRNPLTGIAGATYYLKTKYGSKMSEKGKEMVKIIEKDIEYSNKIISDLLDYSRELRLEFTESTAEVIVKEAIAQVKVPKNIQISNLTQDTPKIKVDAEKMKRVFVNIIKNAVDAMPKGGKLTITGKALEDSLEIAFKDTGEGIKKDTLDKLWSPFFTTKAKGMGLGLPICKRIIEAHGGKISVESTFGKGTTFMVTFPIEPCLEGGEKVWVNMPESLLSTTTKA
jgi:PAS domain S-box-containing protein